MTMTKRTKMTSIFLFFFWYCSACREKMMNGLFNLVTFQELGKSCTNNNNNHSYQRHLFTSMFNKVFTFCNCFNPSSVFTHACSTLKSILSSTVPFGWNKRTYCYDHIMIMTYCYDHNDHHNHRWKYQGSFHTCSTTIPAKSLKISLRSEMDWTTCLISLSRSSTITEFSSTSTSWSSVKPCKQKGFSQILSKSLVKKKRWLVMYNKWCQHLFRPRVCTFI